jgi:hypothetical protein
MIVAWHAVPGTRPPPKGPSRRVRYDWALLIPEVFIVEALMFELLIDVMNPS